MVMLWALGVGATGGMCCSMIANQRPLEGIVLAWMFALTSWFILSEPE